MIQGYYLSVTYLLVSGLLLLQNKYRLELAFMLRFATYLKRSRKGLLAFTSLGVVVFLILMVFPVAPGPRVLGDFVPAMMVLNEALFFLVSYYRREVEKDAGYLDLKMEGRRAVFGWTSLAVAFLHFLLPMFVLL